jgi:hypothetical protein
MGRSSCSHLHAADEPIGRTKSLGRDAEKLPQASPLGRHGFAGVKCRSTLRGQASTNGARYIPHTRVPKGGTASREGSGVNAVRSEGTEEKSSAEKASKLDLLSRTAHRHRPLHECGTRSNQHYWQRRGHRRDQPLGRGTQQGNPEKKADDWRSRVRLLAV